jgi:tricorn protease
MKRSTAAPFVIVMLGWAVSARAAAPNGYYRAPAIHGDTLVFAAEGDLWRVPVAGGLAQRLTTAPGDETNPAISPDGAWLAFTASYEGPSEVYVMPLEGGAPKRLTYEGGGATVAGWTPDGKILYGTNRYATAPDEQVVAVDPVSGVAALLPLAQAHDGSYDGSGTLYFTRNPAQPSKTKRYKGGTAQSIWKWTDGAKEALPLTSDFPGTSRTPMWWKGRIYFATDRDGTMNLWSMDANGHDLKPLTKHRGWDVLAPALGDGKIAYQLGADIRVVDAASGKDVEVPIRLATDLDQAREKWVKEPMDYLTSSHLAPDGKQVVLTAYGKVFVAPVGPGRLVQAGGTSGVRYRDGFFLPDGKKLVALSTESGETEFVTLPADGVGASERLTSDGKVLRWEGVPSPDGKWIAHHDKDEQLWLLDVAAKKSRKIDSSDVDDFSNLAWSPDSRFLVYGKAATDRFTQLILFDVEASKGTPLTSDRYDSYAPAWSPDGRFLYLLSDREFNSLVRTVWGPREPEPFFDRQTKIYLIPMKAGDRSPFAVPDELHPAKKKGETEGAKDGKDAKDAKDAKDSKEPKDAKEAKPAPKVVPELDGIMARIQDVPVPAGNYGSLATDGDRLYVLDAASGPDPKVALKTIKIDPETKEPTVFVHDVKRFELSADRKKVLVAKGEALYVVDVGDKAAEDLSKAKLDLSGWAFPIRPRDEWRQMFDEAWRLERDYFYDRSMHGLDWPAMKKKFAPLVDRVTTRAELNDLLAQMVGELSALHIFVRGGDMRKTPDPIEEATLGARLARDPAAGGDRIEHVYRTDPDQPDQRSPLARPGIDAAQGDVITSINGVPVLSVPDSGALLRNQAGKQVLLKVKPKAGGAERDVVVEPIGMTRDADLRYDEWELTRRQKVEQWSGGKIGYVHLRAMGTGNVTEWYREFYPVFDRPGLLIDVRYNRGGNIDSWILEKLMRRAWFYWQPRVGQPYWNMQYAFRGHAMVICNAYTASDGEAFSEGFRRLGLGKVLGTRTWGGEVWLSSSNVLVDKGIATAAENGVYGPDGVWLIEGHGVDPDIVVDNLPHATYAGDDAQLKAAVDELLKQIAADPRPVPGHPAYPDKSK